MTVVPVLRPLVIAALALGLLSFPACSGPDSGPTGGGGVEDSATTEGAVSGTTEEMAGASIVLPDPGPWVAQEPTATDGFHESTFTLIPSGSTEPQCSVGLAVERGYTGDLDAYRTFLTGLNGDRVSFEDDGNVPDGIDGVIASIDWTDRDGEPFSSMLRTWLTKDKTKITVAIVSAGAELDAGCDRAAIASTLQWAGGA